jgi:hypothetical protein
MLRNYAGMSRPLFILCFLLCFLEGSAQQLPGAPVATPPLSPLMEKSRKTKKTAWILLGAGLAVAGTGLYLDFRERVNSTYGKGGETLFYFGAAATVSSIPLFVLAGKYRRQAALELKREPVSGFRPRPVSSSYPALSLSIPF